ncbi:MAG: HAD-IB family phosphatase [Desulfobacteraceae bacterium]|nr:HAD-IB family phosphatase [Desulfobacteraceae bacterium]MBC2754609.1 HAD-IB family phosphatase [Desulfobacteraceae bacterium]
MNHPPEIFALFDFDKTIVSRDSGYEFIKHRLNSSVIRRLIAFFASPIAIFFYLPIRLRFISHSIFMWIATAGLSEKELGEARKKFLRFYCSLSGVLVYQDALNKMAFHLEAGHKVYIVSGAPTWAIKKISKRLGIQKCKIIGSIEKPVMGGLIYEQHCYGHKKVDLVSDVILQNPHKIYGYTDSAADIPLLSICTHKHVINPTKNHLKKFKRAFGNNFQILNWA